MKTKDISDKIPDSINRAVIILHPKEACRDFCNFSESFDWNGEDYSVLVPDLQDEKECILYFLNNKRFVPIFLDFIELLGFYDESIYPDIESVDVFLEWFDLKCCCMVVDCSDDYLPIGASKFDLYYTERTPNWYIASSGMLSKKEWDNLSLNPRVLNFEQGFSNQWQLEGEFLLKHSIEPIIHRGDFDFNVHITTFRVIYPLDYS